MRPFTATYVVVALVLSVVFGTLWSPAQDMSWYPDISYGLPSLEDGKWWTLVTGLPFAVLPWQNLFVIGGFAVLVGYAEGRLGTARTVVITFASQLIAVLAGSLLLAVTRDAGWEWAVEKATETDLGFSAGMLGVAAVATATIRPPCRMRARLALWAYVLFAFLYIGLLADLAHLIVVLVTMPLASRLAGDRAVRAPALPTRREIRLLAAAGVLLGIAMQFVTIFSPDRLTPLGYAGPTVTGGSSSR